MAKEFGGVGGTVSVEIVITKHQNRIGVCGRLVDDPGFGSETHQGMTREVEHKEECRETQKYDKVDQNSANLFTTRNLAIRTKPSVHELESMQRNCSAACSGK